MPMQFTLHKDFSELEADEWNRLLARSITNTPFLRYEFQRNWWEHRGGGEWQQAELALISARRDGQLVGLAPLFLAQYGGQPALMLIGSLEISDYLDVIAGAQDLAPWLSGLLDFLDSDRSPDWRALDWYNVPDSSPTLAALKGESEKRGWAHRQEIYRPTPYIPLPGSFESYLAALAKKQRHEIRRKFRRLDESGQSAHWFVSGGEDLDRDIDALFVLMAEDPDKATFLTDRMRAQMHAVVRAAHAGGWLWLAFLEIGGHNAAVSLNFDYDNRLWGYNSGVKRDFLDLSPGWVLLGRTLEWAIENGRQEFDFMRGDEGYKYRFGAINRYVVRAGLLRSSRLP